MSTRRRVLAALAVFALGLGVGACGSDSSVTDVIPKTTPELTVPSDTTALGVSVPTTTTSTTSTTTTGTTSTPATGTPAPTTTTPAGTGGTPSGGTTTGTGGTSGQGFQNFCQENPGACP
jgi:hypothetical protein